MAVRAPTFWKAVALVLAILAAFLIHFAYLRVTVSQGVLTYRWLFGRRSLPLANIATSRFEQESGRDTRPLLLITPVGGEPVLRVNLKPFRLADVHALLALPQLRFEGGDRVA